MKRVVAMAIVFMFGATSFVFAQTSAVKLPTAVEVKERLKQDVQEVKKDAVQMKDAVQQGVKEDVKETKESVQEVKKAVKKEVKKFKK